MTAIFHLLYTSQSRDTVTAELLQSILEVARRRNAVDDMSGFLVERQGYFLQLLEGREDLVRGCFQRIRKDVRHHNIVIQGEAFTEERLMPGWTMAQVEWNPKLASAEELLEIFEMGRDGKVYTKALSILVAIRQFARSAQPIVGTDSRVG